VPGVSISQAVVRRNGKVGSGLRTPAVGERANECWHPPAQPSKAAVFLSHRERCAVLEHLRCQIVGRRDPDLPMIGKRASTTGPADLSWAIPATGSRKYAWLVKSTRGVIVHPRSRSIPFSRMEHGANIRADLRCLHIWVTSGGATTRFWFWRHGEGAQFYYGSSRSISVFSLPDTGPQASRGASGASIFATLSGACSTSSLTNHSRP
jgi:hypothetical protein